MERGSYSGHDGVIILGDIAFKDLLGSSIYIEIDTAAIFTDHKQALRPSIIRYKQMRVL